MLRAIVILLLLTSVALARTAEPDSTNPNFVWNPPINEDWGKKDEPNAVLQRQEVPTVVVPRFRESVPNREPSSYTTFGFTDKHTGWTYQSTYPSAPSAGQPSSYTTFGWTDPHTGWTYQNTYPNP